MRTKIDDAIKKIGLALFIGFIGGYIIPFFISYKDGFTNRSVVENFKYKRFSNKHDPSNKFDSLNAIQLKNLYFKIRAINNKIEAVENDISDLNSAKQIFALDTQKNDLLKSSKIKAVGFFESRLSLIRPVSITALLIIYFVILPAKPKIKWRSFFSIFVPVGTIFIFPNILRAIGYGNETRVIYSVYSWEINRLMNSYNLLLDIFTIAMIVLIWLKSDAYVTSNFKNHFSDLSLEGVINTLTAIKRNYNVWQFFSIGLFIVFGTLLYNLYADVFIDKDKRFLFQAIFFNFIYAFTWLLGSIPLYLEFEMWRSFKEKVLFDSALEKKMTDGGINVTELRKLIPDYEIASSLNHSITIIFSGISFFLPLIKAVWFH